jgi:hypothetical protein
VDVSDNVSDDGTNEIPNPFEVAPFAVGATTNVAPGQLMPAGSQITFHLNLSDPLIYGYVQQGLNDGDLSFVVTSLVNANYFTGSPNWLEFYTIFSPLASTNEYPLLTIQGTVVRPCADSDGDRLPDDWERFYFGTLGAGWASNADNDGVNNVSKYAWGANPTNAASDLRLLRVARQENGAVISFVAASSRHYTIQGSDDLKAWQTVPAPAISYTSAWLAKTNPNPPYPSPVFAQWRETNSAGQQSRFYRVGTQ